MPNAVKAGWKPNKTSISVYLFLCSAGVVLAGFWGLVGNKFSSSRLALLVFALILGGTFSFLGWKIHSTPQITEAWHRHINEKTYLPLICAAGLLSLVSWATIWTPLESFGSLYYYMLGIYPFLFWLTFASAGALVLLLSARFGFAPFRVKELLGKERTTYLVAGCCLVIFGLLAWIASARIFNIKPAEEDFWYGAGVPVLAIQALAALVIGFGLSWIINKFVSYTKIDKKRINLLIFILIWAISAWLWASQPVRPDFLITQPVAPNFEMYPDYDARNYDIMSQFALIGQGINNHSFFDRVLYSSFLVYLHNLVGQDYSALMSVQAAIFAIIPALLYLIGNRLRNQATGLALGLLITFRGINQIDVGNIIETAHQKHMLTEYPTAVLLVLVTLFLIKWAQEPTKNWAHAGLAGGILSLSTLLRPHPLALIPLIIALSILVYKKRVRLWIGLSALVICSALLGILPWLQFGGQNISIVNLYMTRITTIINERYPQLLPPQGSQPTPEAQSPTNTPRENQTIIPAAPAPEKSVLAFAADHFLNNLVTGVLILPTSPFNLDARVVIKKTENIWKAYWDGVLTPWGRLLLMLNLLFVALGLGSAWKRTRLAGLIPALILAVYFGVNALARTSGGRYLVPVDWVIVIYYVLGLVTALELALSFFFQSENSEKPIQTVSNSVSPWPSALVVLLISASLGALIPLSQIINPLHFQQQTKTELAQQFSALTAKNSGISDQNLNTFLNSENAVILKGRSLYPRQFNKDEGLDISIYPFYHSQPYPRTLFTLIGQNGEKVIMLPRTNPAKIPNSTDMLVIGCSTDGFIQAWAVLNLADNNLFTRLPASPLPNTCPLPDPICDNNKNCH